MPSSRTELGQVLLWYLAFRSSHESSRTATQLNCNARVNFNTGCGVTFPTQESFGPPFNSIHGGWCMILRVPRACVDLRCVQVCDGENGYRHSGVVLAAEWRICSFRRDEWCASNQHSKLGKSFLLLWLNRTLAVALGNSGCRLPKYELQY
jgi:hypothetical protein